MGEGPGPCEERKGAGKLAKARTHFERTKLERGWGGVYRKMFTEKLKSALAIFCVLAAAAALETCDVAVAGIVDTGCISRDDFGRNKVKLNKIYYIAQGKDIVLYSYRQDKELLMAMSRKGWDWKNMFPGSVTASVGDRI